MKVNPHRSSLGMDANIMAMLCYIAAFVLSWIPVVKWVAWAAPLVIFFVEKESPFVKFHAMQAFLLEVVSWIIQVIVGIIIAAATASFALNAYNMGAWRATFGIAGILTLLSVLFGLFLTVVAIIALVKAYQYVEFKIPVIGNIALNISRKNNAPKP